MTNADAALYATIDRLERRDRQRQRAAARAREQFPATLARLNKRAAADAARAIARAARNNSGRIA